MEHEPTPTSVKRSSASLRYWKARLQVFKRPTVWGALLLLLLPLIFLANYWHNPQGFILSSGSAQGDSPSPDGQSAAEFEEDGTTTASPTISDASTLIEVPALPEQAVNDGQAEAGQTGSGTSSTLLEALLSAPLPELSAQPSLAQSESRSRNPFASQSRSSEPSSVRPVTGTGNAALLSSPLLAAGLSNALNGSGGSASEAGSSSNQLVLSPLQVALDRSAGISNSGNSSAGELQTNSSLNSSANAFSANSSTNLTAQAASSAGQVLPWLMPTTGQYARPLGTSPLGTQLYIPQTSPFPGTTGYTLPSALRPTNSFYYSNGYAGSYFNGAYGYANPLYAYPSAGYSTLPQSLPQLTPTVPIQTLPVSPYGRSSYSPYGNGYSTGVPIPVFSTPAPAVSPQPAPFSIPRTPPGRYIGGGEINTFSNP